MSMATSQAVFYVDNLQLERMKHGIFCGSTDS